MLLVQTRVVDVHKKQLVLDEILKDLDRIANDSLPQVMFSHKSHVRNSSSSSKHVVLDMSQSDYL